MILILNNNRGPKNIYYNVVVVLKTEQLNLIVLKHEIQNAKSRKSCILSRQTQRNLFQLESLLQVGKY